MVGNVFSSSIALSSSSGGSAPSCAIALRYGSSYWIVPPDICCFTQPDQNILYQHSKRWDEKGNARQGISFLAYGILPPLRPIVVVIQTLPRRVPYAVGRKTRRITLECISHGIATPLLLLCCCLSLWLGTCNVHGFGEKKWYYKHADSFATISLKKATFPRTNRV